MVQSMTSPGGSPLSQGVSPLIRVVASMKMVYGQGPNLTDVFVA